MDSRPVIKSEMVFARADPALVQRIDAAAAADKRRRSEWVRLTIEQYLDLRDRGLEPTIKALMAQPVSTR